jgi:hypothetical protein
MKSRAVTPCSLVGVGEASTLHYHHRENLTTIILSKFYRVLTVVHDTRDYWVFGLFPSSRILKNAEEHNVSEGDLFPSSGEGVGDTYPSGSVRKS